MGCCEELEGSVCTVLCSVCDLAVLCETVVGVWDVEKSLARFPTSVSECVCVCECVFVYFIYETLIVEPDKAKDNPPATTWTNKNDGNDNDNDDEPV